MEQTESRTSGTLADLARRLHVSRPAVTQGVRRGRFPRSVVHDATGRPAVVDMDLAEHEWRATTKRLSNGRPPSTNTTGAVPLGTTITLTEAQRQVAIERARQLKIANDIRQGQLIDANQAAKDAFESARVLREAVLNLPARLAPELAAETDATRIFTRLDAELRQALEWVSKELAS